MGASGCRVKWQNAAFENLKDSVGGLRQPIFASTLGKGADPEQQLRDCYAGEIECLRDLLVEPCLYRHIRLGFDSIGNDVGVEDDHSKLLGASAAGLTGRAAVRGRVWLSGLVSV